MQRGDPARTIGVFEGFKVAVTTKCDLGGALPPS